MEGGPHVTGKGRSALGCSLTFSTLVLCPLRTVRKCCLWCALPTYTQNTLGNLPLAQQQGCSAGEGILSKGTVGALSGMNGSIGRKRSNLFKGK